MIFPFKNKQAGPYNYGDQTDYGASRHLGVDWYTYFEPLVAPKKSKIVLVTTGQEGGLMIGFQPLGETTIIRWLHLSKEYVTVGQIVEEGQLLCISGNSGHRPGSNTPYQPHTHEDIWKSKVTLNFEDTINPHIYYAKHGEPMIIINNTSVPTTKFALSSDMKIGFADFPAFQKFIAGRDVVNLTLADVEFNKIPTSQAVIKS